MLTRSLSYYTLSRQSSLSQHPFERSSTDFSVEDVNDLLDPPSTSHTTNGATVRDTDGLTRSSTAMPRSISMSRLTHPVPNSSAPFKSPHTRSQIHHQRAVHHAHSRSMAFPRTPTHASTTMVELVDDSVTSTPSPPAATTMITSSTSVLGDGIGPTTASQPMDIAGTNGKVTPANESIGGGGGVPKSSTPPSPNSPSPLVSNSTSPVEVFSTESTSLPLFRAPIVGNALIHPVNDSLSSDHLPAALIEDFDIIGRAGEESTCDTWIVRSKNSGKLAVFKPRDGENWIERQQWESRERERLDRERRMNRFGRGQAGASVAGGASDHLIAEPSSSCPHPLSYSTALRTPLKRGVLYGETTRKEVAAYLMDHEHFAGVPKTVEATIFLARNQAPNQGMNKHETGVLNYHPYLHGEPPSGNLALPSGDTTTSPELAGQGRLLLMAASNSPPLSAVQSSSEPHFPFDSEEVWLGPSATAGVTGTDATPERSIKFTRHDSPTSEPFVTPPSHHGANTHRHSQGMHHPHTHVLTNANLAPPPTLLTPNSAQSSPTATTFDSPNFGPTAGSSPDRDSDGGFHGLGLGLPTSASELVATYGSLQEFVENQGSAEDMGSNVFLSDEVHRIGILDVRLLNLDRHLGNLLVSRDHAGRPHLIPVDHGFSLPSVHALQDVHLEWTYWRQCMEPFSKETLRYIARLDPIADAAKLRNIGIRDEALVAMVFSSLLLKYAAASGLTLFHIARMCQRDGDGEEPSTLEVIVARVLGSQIDASPEPPMTSPKATSEDQPSSVTFDYAMTTQELPVVEEEGLQSPSSLASSRYMSRQNSSCSQHGFQPSPNQSNSSQSSRFASPAPYPTPTPRTDSDEDDCDGEEVFPSRPSTELTIPSATDLPPAAPMTTLLTRSNSDGAMALAEAIIGRQYSAPNLGESETKDENVEQTDCARPSSSISSSSSTSSSNSAKRPWNGFTRRRSIADAAAQIIALVTPSGSSPPSNPFMSEPASIAVPVATSGHVSKTDSPVRDAAAVSSPDCEFSPVELPTPPPPNILRLGTELTLYEANANSSNGGVNGDIPTGPKLQHLLHITETVIREELANYCQRQGITLQTPTAASASSKESPPTPSASSNSATSSNSTTATAILHAPTPRSPSQSLPPPSQSPRTSSINGNELGSSQSASSTASPYTRTPSLRERLAAAAAAKRAAMAAAASAAGTTATSTSAVSVAHSSSSLSSLSLSEVPTSTVAVAATSLTPLGSTLPSIQLAPPSLVIPPIVHHHARDKDDSSSSLANVPSHIVTSSSPPSSTSSHRRTYSNVDSHVTVDKHHPITAES